MTFQNEIYILSGSQLNRGYFKNCILKQLRPIGEGDQELEKRLDQKELT
jgi:hypothetical protein